MKIENLNKYSMIALYLVSWTVLTTWMIFILALWFEPEPNHSKKFDLKQWQRDSVALQKEFKYPTARRITP